MTVEGSTVALPPATFTDADTGDTHTATIDWGDGYVVAGTVSESGGSGTVSGSHPYADNGVYGVTVTVLDNNGGSASDSFLVTVFNASPVVGVGPDQATVVGASISVPVSFSDPGTGDTHVYIVDWGDGNTTFGTPALTFNVTHSYASVGGFTVTMDVFDDDGASSSDSLLVAVHSPNGTATATGATSLCRDNMGGTATISLVPPCAPVLYQWGYRTVSGTGSVTDIAGKTGTAYDIQGSDFPSPGGYPVTYYLVCRQVSPTCGTFISNEIPITLTGASCGTAVSDPVQFFNVTTRNSGGVNILQWVTPAAGAPDLRINSRTDGTFPTDPADGTAVVTGTALPAGTKFSYNDATIVNGTTYSYGAFTCAAGCGAGDFSGAKEAAARPFNSPVKIKWVYSTAGIATTPPGMKTGTGPAVLAVSNDRNLHAMAAGASGGTWPAPWMPYAMNAPSQSRPIPITLNNTTIGGTKTVVFVGSQDGRVYAFNSTTGALLWTSPVLGESIQASPSAMFAEFGGVGNLVFAGTRNSAAADNQLHALNALTGAVVWSFDNGGGANGIGIISGQPSVDYANKRVYFTSRTRGGGSSDTVWCLRILTPTTYSKLWSVSAGPIDAAPINFGGTLYVGNTSGDVTALVPATGASKWLSSFATGDGAVKTLIWPDSGRLYFSTTTKVWAITDNGASTTPTAYWTSPVSSIPHPSNPIVLSNRAYVGGGDGKLYQITSNVVSPPAPLSVTLGDPSAPFQVGQPSNDTANGLLVVGTESGQIYAVARPF